MKYLRKQNLNLGNVLDNTVLQTADGNIELNPTHRVVINGDVDILGGVPSPEVTNVMYVTMDGDDANSGMGEGPNQAKRTIKSAVEAAQEGTTIFVRSGEYYEDNPIRLPPKVSIIGDNLRRTILRPLNGPKKFNIVNVQRTDSVVTLTTDQPHGFELHDRVRITITAPSGAADVNDECANIIEITSTTSFKYKDFGTNLSSTAVSDGIVEKGFDFFLVSSQTYIAGLVFKGLQAPGYCINIDKDAIVDTSPYVQNCSNINGPWLKNGTEWLPFITKQPDLTGTMVTGPRPLRDDEIDPLQLDQYGINERGAGGGMLIDGDRYNQESPIKSMVADAFTQVAQGAIAFHITNFGYMQLVSCFAVFCDKAFYTTKGGYLSISNSVVDFGNQGFVADGYYPLSYSTGIISSDYYSTVGSATVGNLGSGYTTAPLVTIQPPDPGVPGGIQATGIAFIDIFKGTVTAVAIDNPGFGYTFEPTITIGPPIAGAILWASSLAVTTSDFIQYNNIFYQVTVAGTLGSTPPDDGSSLQTNGTATLQKIANTATATANLAKNNIITINNLTSKPQIASVMFLGNDPIGYYITETLNSTLGFTFNETKCRRDIGYIIEAVTADAVFNTDFRSIYAGVSYLRSQASKVTSLQKAETIAGINQARDYILSLPSVSGNATMSSRITANFLNVTNIIQNGISAISTPILNPVAGQTAGLTEAAQVLLANKTYLENEIIAYINANFVNNLNQGFNYNETKCARDVGIILESVLADLILGTNYNSKYSGLSYLRSYANEVTEYQKSQTIDGINRAKDLALQLITDLDAIEIIKNNFEIVKTIINAGSKTSAAATFYTNPIGFSSGVIDSARQLEINRSFIVEEIVSYIKDNLNTSTIIRYDENKCRRDTEYIVDALIFDILYSGNTATRLVAQSFYDENNNNVVSTQIAEHVAAFTRLKNVVGFVIQDSTAWTKSVSNPLAQNTTLNAGTETVTAQGLIDVISNAIQNGIGTIPSQVLPAYSNGSLYSYYSDERTKILADKTAIENTVIEYLNKKYLANFSYDDTTCRRDIRYIVDALSYDLTYGGNTQTTNAALAYAEGSVIDGEIEETKAAYEYWKSILPYVLQNEDVPNAYAVGQVKTTPLGSPVPQYYPSTIAQNLLQIVIDVIDHSTGYVPEPVTESRFDLANSTLNAIRLTVLEEIVNAQNFTIEYLNTTYGGTVDVRIFPGVISVNAGAEVKFHNVSTISTGGTALEYVGAGITYNALPFFGGEPIPTNERIEINNGKCFTVTNDQVGNFRVGGLFTVNALTGTVTLDANQLDLVGLESIGPFIRNNIPVGVEIKEVSNNTNLIASNGLQDIFTVPTQFAVSNYVEDRYLNKVQNSTPQTVESIVNFQQDVIIDNEKELKFYENNLSPGTNYVSFKAPNDLVETYALNLPIANATKVGQLLGNDSFGNLAWYDADNFGGSRIYVSAEKGNDLNDGINAPVKTIKRALQLASGKVYDSFGVPNGEKWNVAVSAGSYYEDNPIIVPDNVSVIGDGLRACILRPLNSNKDMLRVRNGCYFTEFTFRDALTGAPSNPSPTGSPIYTWNYAVAFDDPLDATVSRVGYTNLPSTKPTIHTSPYIQNCSIISFLGGNGALVDGSKVISPNRPPNDIEAENPVNISNGIPEQGKSMVANAFTMLSFGGTGWRVINDAYVQIVSCFQIFMLNGTYTQSGGYCSITNSATNFGLYALRASGFSPNAFAFDRGYIATTGTNDNKQTLTAFGWTRPNGPIEEFIVRIYDPVTEADLTDGTYKLLSGGYGQASFNAAVAPVIGNPGAFNISLHGFNTGDQVTYLTDGGTTIGGLFNGDSYFVQVINVNSFRLAFDDSFTRFVEIISVGSGTQRFRRNDYEMIVNKVLENHNTFQTLTLAGGPYTFSPGDLITGLDLSPPGYPHSAYVYSYNSGTNELVVVINKVTIGIDQIRVQFNATSQITSINGVTLGSPILLSGVSGKSDLWAATFEIVPTTVGGQFTGLASLPGKKVWFHRPSITNSSAHTWEYAGSGIDYNALPQNGGRTIEKYEQYGELAGQVYSSGTNELGDFKVGDFIRAFNRTGNVNFTNEVSINKLDVLRLALSDVEITAISTDPDLGENEIGGPSDSRLSTQLSIWSYSNNRLGPFIDKNVSTNAVPGNIVQLNSNGQINRDLIPSQRNFSSFITLGFNSRLTLLDDIPVNDSQSGDICTERYEEVPLTLNLPITASKGWLVTQANSGATGYLTDNVTNSTNISIGSIYGTFETPAFTTNFADVLTINGDATPSTTNTSVYPTIVGTIVNSTSNYFISSSSSSQYLIVSNTSTFTYTNVAASTAVRFNNVIYVESATHGLFTGNRVQLNLTDDDFDKVEYATVFDTTRFSIPGSGTNTPATGTTTATATIVGVTGTSTTGSCTDASLTGTIAVGDWVFGGGLPLGSRITAVDLSGDPNTFTVTFPSSTTVAGTLTATLTFITPVARTGTVKTVITAADSLASGTFDESRSGVLTGVNNLTFTNGTGYTPAVGTAIYLRVPLTNVSGTGTGAIANITVSNGSVTDVDIFRGGTGYVIGNVLSAASANIGGTGSGFQISVTGVEQRIYVDIVGGQLFVATTGAIDFIEDNNSLNTSITATDSTTKGFNAAPIGSGGNVDYALNRITITGHGFANGDPVKYDPAPNIAMGGLTTGNVYYIKSIDVNTVELYQEYNLANQMSFGASSTGTHNLIRYAVNLIDNSFYVPAHGFITGDAVRMSGTNLPSYNVGAITTQIANNNYFFVGSITTNSFTLHDLRSDALASVGGITSVPYNISATGSGTITFTDNDITVVGVVNTSSQYSDNWNVLVADNIDASNIVSGIISTSRLGTETANSDTFLNGGSQYKPVVQALEYVDSNSETIISTGSLLTVGGTGSISSSNYGSEYSTNDKSGRVNIDIQRVDQLTGDYSSLGVASFLKQHFVVGTNATNLNGGASITSTTNGRVYIRPASQGGTVDAATLETRNLSYVLDSQYHTTQPVSKGGTNITTYTQGDILYASTGGPSSVLSTLGIGAANTVLTSTSTAPQWSSSLTLGGDLSVAGTSSIGSRAYSTTNITAGITSAAAVQIDSFDRTVYRSGEYTMQVTCTAGTDNSTYQISKVLVIHDSTTSTLTEYGLIKTGTNELATYTTDISGSTVRIFAQASSGNTITVQLVRTLQTV